MKNRYALTRLKALSSVCIGRYLPNTIRAMGQVNDFLSLSIPIFDPDTISRISAQAAIFLHIQAVLFFSFAVTAGRSSGICCFMRAV